MAVTRETRAGTGMCGAGKGVKSLRITSPPKPDDSELPPGSSLNVKENLTPRRPKPTDATWEKRG